jgi:hypothetical protein
MTEEIKKEEISLGYLKAICASQGISMNENRRDEDGIDAYLSKILLRSNGSKFNAKIDVQLKSSSCGYVEHNNYYAYPLKVKNYNDLREPSSTKPYLFLLVLPENEQDWVIHDIDKLMIKKCMFWLDLADEPETKNTSTITVHFPKTQIVSPEVLESMLQEDMRNKLGEEV